MDAVPPSPKTHAYVSVSASESAPVAVNAEVDYGTADTTVDQGNTDRMAAKLKSFGSEVKVIKYKGTGHIGTILSLVPGFRGTTSLRQDMIDFIRSY